MRVVHAIVALLFLGMAVIQLNDPDPAYWVAVYVVVAAVPAAMIFDRRLPTTSAVAAGMVLAGLLIAAPGFVDYLASGDYAAIGEKMKDEKPYVETAREVVGLLIAAAGLIFYGRSGQRLAARRGQ